MMRHYTITIAVALALVGCRTTRPDDTGIVHVDPPVETTEIAWDGVDQNAGVIDTAPGGFLVTSGFVTRMRALADRYGVSFVPRLDAAGVSRYLTPSGDNFVISPEGMIAMMDLVDLHREGRIVPAGTTLDLEAIRSRLK